MPLFPTSTPRPSCTFHRNRGHNFRVLFFGMTNTDNVKTEKATKTKTSSVNAWKVGVLALLPVFFIQWLLSPYGYAPQYAIPNLLLFTGFRKYTQSLWSDLVEIDTKVRHDPVHIPVIEAADYSFESLRRATDNFRFPAVVRGLFASSPAVQKWGSAEYLSSKLGEHVVPVVRTATYGAMQNDRTAMPFGEAFSEIHEHEQSKMYLFFPVKSRFSFNHSELGALELLQKDVDSLVAEDLELEQRLWRGFGTKAHATFMGSQLIVGRGSKDSEETTGTGWHCAAGNNWFVQVLGTKRWYFLDPVYSHLMSPLRGGKVNMMTGSRTIGNFHQNLPLRYADIHSGDLLYNPDWEWHTIKNHEGLSIGVPIREFNASLSLQNNKHFMAIVAWNIFLEKIGLSVGGYPAN